MQRRSEARRVMGFGLSLLPLDVFRASDDPNTQPVLLPVRQATYLIELYNNNHVSHPVDVPNAYKFVGAAMGQAWEIMNTAIEHDPRDLSVEEAIAMGHDERTLNAYAVMASQTDGISSIMIKNHHGAFYRVTEDRGGIEISPGVNPSTEATCPEAGPRGKVEPTPLMRRFVPWATELAVYSILRSKIERTQPTVDGDTESVPLMLAK